MQLAPATPKEGSTGMHAILLRMHAQNASFIDLFGTLSNSLQTFMTTLQLNNLGIMTEIANLSPTSLDALSDQVVACVGAEGTEMTQPGVAVGTSLGVGMHDWHYMHADGKPAPVLFNSSSSCIKPFVKCSDDFGCWLRQVFGGEFPQTGLFLIVACKKCTSCGTVVITKTRFLR